MPSMSLKCALCNMPMQKTRTSKPQGEAAHNKCRTAVGGLFTHGLSGYDAYGCRCDTCKAAKAVKMRAYMANHRAEHGEAHSTTWRRAFRDANGYWPQLTNSAWIDPKMRRELYERDSWECALCERPVDREAHWNADFAPSLDHIMPRSLGGSHDPENLRTAHRICNSLRGVTV